jgi:DNA polymerase-3 subunit epsilon
VFLSRRAGATDRSCPLDEARFTVLDTELTGLNEKVDTIVSVGAVKMVGARIDLRASLSLLVSPQTALSRESVLIHGITPTEAAAGIQTGEALRETVAFVGDDIVVGHFVAIDLLFLARALAKAGIKRRWRGIDTAVLCAWLARRTDHPALSCCRGDYSLFHLASCFGIEVNGAHQAIMDAYTTAQLFQRLIPLVKEEGVDTVGQLLRIGDPDRSEDIHRVTREISNF